MIHSVWSTIIYKIRALQKKKEKLWQNKINKNKIQKLSTATTNNTKRIMVALWSVVVFCVVGLGLGLSHWQLFFGGLQKKKMLCVLGSKNVCSSHIAHTHTHIYLPHISSKLHLYNPQNIVCAEWVSAATRTTTIGWFGLVGCFEKTHTHIHLVWFWIYLCDWPSISTLPSAASSSFLLSYKHTHTHKTHLNSLRNFI